LGRRGAILRDVAEEKVRDMSEENVGAARRMHKAFNRTFSDGTPDLFEILDPGAEWIPITAVLDGTSYRGESAIRRWMDDMKSHWEVYELRPEEFLGLGDDRVLVLGTWRARGRGSGVELNSQQAAWLIRFEAGKVIRMQTFTDRLKAFEAAGLR
jgi:ketosteroid isomerase-like protein